MLQGLQFSVGAVSEVKNPSSGLNALARRVVEDARLKYDLHAKTDQVAYVTEGGETKLRVADHGAFTANENAHRQVRAYTGIDAKYYDRIRAERTTVIGGDGLPTEKSLLDINVNHFLRGTGDTRLIRTKDGVFRAFLSDRYRPMDNEDLLEAIIPTLLEIGGDLEVASCNVTDSKLYLKLVSRNRWREVGVGSIVYMGVSIENDECGNGSISAIPFSVVKACENGMKHTEFGTRRNHVGGKIDIGSAASAIFADDTLRADDKAYWLKFRDIVKAAMSDDILDKVTAQMNEAAGIKIAAPIEAVKVLANRFRISDSEQNTMLENLLSGAHGAGSHNLWGLANSITWAAGQSSDYDRSTELEEIGGKVLGMPATATKSEMNELVLAGAR